MKNSTGQFLNTCLRCKIIFRTSKEDKKFCSTQCYNRSYNRICKNRTITHIEENWVPLNELPTDSVWEKGMGGRDCLAEKVRVRDNHTCQICGKIWQEGKRRFDVHHLDENCESVLTCENYKKFDRMITLCHKCHLRLKHIRNKFILSHPIVLS